MDTFSVGDRVMVKCRGAPVPFGATGLFKTCSNEYPGIVIGVKGSTLDLLLDHQCIGASHLGKTCSNMRGCSLPTTWYKFRESSYDHPLVYSICFLNEEWSNSHWQDPQAATAICGTVTRDFLSNNGPLSKYVGYFNN